MAGYNIDLADPRVQEVLGPVPNQQRRQRQIVQLAGDAPDPMRMHGQPGLLSTHNLGAAKQEIAVLYRDHILTVDVYALPGEPIKVHLICPRCHKCLTIASDQKAIEFDPLALNPQRQRIMDAVRDGDELDEIVAVADFGRISIAPFECTWEVGGDQHVAGGLHTGASMCNLKLAIDNNRAVDA